MTRPIDALCIGEAMIALAAADGDIRAAERLTVSVAGAEANVAVSLARAGHRTAWAGAVGADPLGRRVVETLAAHGVDVALACEGRGPTGMYVKTPAGPLYYRSGSAASRMTAETADRWAATVRPAVVHLSGVLAVLSPSAEQLARRIVEQRPFGDAVVSFDVNARPALADARTPQVLLDLARAADVVFVGRDEAQALWGTTDAASIRSLLAQVGTLVVKDADIEAVSYIGDERTAVPALAVEVVEATGAGDGFAAGWLGAWLDGADARARLVSGHQAAAAALMSTDDVPAFGGAPR
jgi:2-dehydro-3-deoxygluconokinase